VAQITKRLLVVDDSAFMRRLITEVAEFRADFRVVGTASNGVEAIEKVRSLSPDIVTLDIAMPQMDGLTALERIMTDMPRPVIVVSAAGSSNLNASAVRALELGAVEFVRKPSGEVSIDLLVIRDQLLRALDTASQVRFGEKYQSPRIAPAVPVRRTNSTPPHRAGRVVVVAASTGGPRALADVVSQLSCDLDAAVLIVQHMPSEFIPTLADRLAQICSLPVAVASNGEKIIAGRVYVAPGDGQMRIGVESGSATIVIDAGDPIFAIRPAADPLFASAAKVFGRRAIGVVLSGMGRDGSEGLRAIRGAGGGAIIQDRSSSIVFGMPGAALATAGADCIVPSQRIAGAIDALLVPGRRVA
jgi:two-component system, chemotaxis family, protein-glutamate methylesterase/glutaminase